MGNSNPLQMEQSPYSKIRRGTNMNNSPGTAGLYKKPQQIRNQGLLRDHNSVYKGPSGPGGP